MLVTMSTFCAGKHEQCSTPSARPSTWLNTPNTHTSSKDPNNQTQSNDQRPSIGRPGTTRIDYAMLILCVSMRASHTGRSHGKAIIIIHSRITVIKFDVLFIYRDRYSRMSFERRMPNTCPILEIFFPNSDIFDCITKDRLCNLNSVCFNDG